MFTIPSHLVRYGALLLLGTAASFSPSSARADLTSCAPGLVCYYVAIQPIDVCSSNGTGCAPFNTSSKIGNPGAATSTTPIGFVDTASKKDITRAVWNQLGVDIAWSPMRQYNNTTYQTLHIVQCNTTNLPCATTTPTGLTSTDFLALSQQNGISQGTAGYPNPNPPNAPVSSQRTVVNMFFVNTLVPPPGTSGALYGFSWINNNGIAIGSSAFFPPFPLTPRFDTLAHELGHNLGLDHGDSFNVNTPNTASINVMTAGASRTEPGSTSAAIIDVTPGAPGYGAADQFNVSNTPNQRARVALSGLLNPIASSTTTASTSGGGAITTALVVSDTVGDMTTITAAPNSTKPDTRIFFDVTAPTGGRDGETLVGLILTLGKGLHFDPTSKVSFLNGSGQYVVSAAYDHGNTGDSNCPDPASQCLVIQLKSTAPQSIDFSQGIVGAPGIVGSSGKTVTPSDILNAGASMTYKFSDGLIITADFALSLGQQLTANSQIPSTTVPAKIDPIQFTSADDAPPCTPIPPPTILIAAPAAAILSCPDPTATPVGDGNPNDEAQPPSPGGG
jgi:hypothetical protein